MKVYETTVVEGYEWVIPKDEAHFDIFHSFDGGTRASSWIPIPVELVKQGEHGEKFDKESDSPWLGGGVLVLRRRAVDLLGPFLSSYGELLPLVCDEAELWAFNARYYLDALDLRHSRVHRFRDGGIMRVETFVFLPEIIDGYEVFKLRDMLRGWTFVSERFVELVQSSGLRGLGFKLLWDSEAGAALS